MYNIACCFSKLGQLDNSLQALKKCMGAGWTDYKKIRTDPSLAEVRTSPNFKAMIDKLARSGIKCKTPSSSCQGIFGGK